MRNNFYFGGEYVRTKILLLCILAIGMLVAGCTDDTPAATEAPAATDAPAATEAPAPETTVYTGTVYVAGMGGHFAKAAIEIDPTNTEDPITVTSLKRTVLGAKDTYPTHDPRVDVHDPNTMFWSTYKKDANGQAHVGATDLSTGKKTSDVAIDLDARVGEGKDGSLYCASGQSKDSYIPVTMTHEG